MIDIDETKPWTWYVENADMILKLTPGNVWLHAPYGEAFDPDQFPWHLPMSEVRVGGTYYGSIPAGVVFEAKHPNGLVFRWSVEFYGSSTDFRVNGERIGIVLSRLDDAGKKLIRAGLVEMVRGLEKYRNEARAELARREESLRTLADYGIGEPSPAPGAKEDR